jgi:hypothetical protein
VGGSGPKGPDFAGGTSGVGAGTNDDSGGISVTGPTQLCEVWRNGQLVPLDRFAHSSRTSSEVREV